jgi:hypothetical protein
MQYKVLKHKKLEETFGVFHGSDNSEIWQSSTPTLFGRETTLEYLKKINNGSIAYKQLDSYDLVAVELIIRDGH